jgi:hypothetical protein
MGVDSVTDAESISAWIAFLEEYAKGNVPGGTPMPPLTEELLNLSKTSRANPPRKDKVVNTAIYTSAHIDQETARRVRQYYCENLYLPPPRSAKEDRRSRLLAEYNISGDEQMRNLQASTDLISAFFPGVLCTFSLFKGDLQYHYAVTGPEWIKAKYNVYVGVRIPSEDSLCGHAVLGAGHKLFHSTLDEDWRYIRNPFKLAGFKTYVASVVALPSDPCLLPDEPGSDECIGIGTLNLCFVDDAPEVLTESQKIVVLQVTRNLQTQLKATWEGHRRTKVARTNREVGRYIRDALDTSNGTSPVPAVERRGSRAPDGTTDEPYMDLAPDAKHGADKQPAGPTVDFKEMARDACQRMAERVLQAGNLCIIDLRSVKMIVSRPYAKRKRLLAERIRVLVSIVGASWRNDFHLR